jgi:hypothetical protein
MFMIANQSGHTVSHAACPERKAHFPEYSAPFPGYQPAEHRRNAPDESILQEIGDMLRASSFFPLPRVLPIVMLAA